MLTARPRRGRLAYSEEMTFVPTRIPPMPRPVTTRQIPSSQALLAVAERNRPAALTTTASIVMLRRPMRSATGPRVREPTAMPSNPALSRNPSSDPLSPNSSVTGVAVKAMASTS